MIFERAVLAVTLSLAGLYVANTKAEGPEVPRELNLMSDYGSWDSGFGRRAL